MICTPNNCSAIKHYSFLGQSCIQAKISKLWFKAHVTDSFCMPFCAYYVHMLKTKGCIKTLYLTKDCSTSGDMYFLG